MEFKAGDRVHVTRFNDKNVDFYGTVYHYLYSPHFFKLKDCSNNNYENRLLWKGLADGNDYYTLATDEEDTEKPEIQYINDTSDYELELGDWIQYVAVNGEDRFGKVIGFQRSMDEQQIYMNLSLLNGNSDSIPRKSQWVKNRPNEAFLLDTEYNNLKSNAPCNRLERRTNNVVLDDEYIIEAKKGLYAEFITPSDFFRFTRDIKESIVYKDKSDAIKRAKLIDGRVLKLKRYVEV